MKSYTSTFCIPATHPALPGHFPGRPLVPGAVTLSEVATAWQKLDCDARVVCGFGNVKFLSPLLPDETAQIAFTDKGAGNVSFEVNVDARRVASGTLRCEHG